MYQFQEGVRLKRVLIYCPDQDPTSFYRGARPWQLMEKILGPEYKVTYICGTSPTPLRTTWDQMGFFDVVFFQRPFHPDLLQAAHGFKRMGAKIWVDEDDLQTDVPWSFHAAYVYMTDPIQNTIRGILSIADVVTVSVDYLGEKLKEFAKCPIYTIPNAFDLATFPKPTKLPPKEKTIIWRGSAASHQADLLEYRHEIYNILKANPDWNMYFVGLCPWWYSEFKDEFPEGWPKNATFVRHTPTMFEYMDMLRHLNPAIWIVPLNESEFNKCKSNLAWMEASWIEAQVIGMDWPEWKRDGLLNFTKDKTLSQTIQSVIDHPSVVDAYPKMSWRWIEQNILLPKWVDRRIEILKELIG